MLVQSCIYNKELLPKNRKAHPASRIDIGIESSPPAVCCYRIDVRCFGWIFSLELDGELKESKLVRGVWRSDDEGTYVTYVDVAARNGKREVGSSLDLAQFL
jgi:hypothetical protein